MMALPSGAVAQLGARLDGIEEAVGSNPIGSTKSHENQQYSICRPHYSRGLNQV